MNNYILNYGIHSLYIMLALLPSIILGIIVYKKDLVEKEPVSMLIKLFLYGILSAGVALLIELNLESLFPNALNRDMINIFIRSFIIVAFTEELVKWAFNYISCYKNKEFNYTYDAIVYSVFIALGFATIENIIVILSNNGDFLLTIQRGLITVPAHAFFGVLSGYYIGKAKKYNNRGWYKKEKQYLMFSIIFPTLIHGLFDFLLFISNKTTMILPILLIIYLYITSYIKVSKVSKEIKMLKKND